MADSVIIGDLVLLPFPPSKNEHSVCVGMVIDVGGWAVPPVTHLYCDVLCGTTVVRTFVSHMQVVSEP